jgi:zinc protease
MKIKQTILSLMLLSVGTNLLAQGSKEINFEGLKVIYKKTPKQVITVGFYIKGGVANISEANQGIEQLTLNLVANGGTTTMDKNKWADAAELMSTSFGASAVKDYSAISMTCLKDNWEKSWSMMADAISNPAWDENEFSINKQQMIAAAKNQESNPDAYLRRLATKELFAGSAYALFSGGTVATIESLTLDQCKEHYKKILGKKRSYLVVVGNVDEADLLAKLKASFSKLPEGSLPADLSVPNVKAPTAKIESRKLSTNYILGNMNAPKYFSPDGPLFEFAMDILYDRFFVELRTKRSLSYAPAAGYNNGTIQQPLTQMYISTIKPKEALEVMTQIIDDVRKNGFTEKEVRDKKKEYLTNFYMTNETSSFQVNRYGFCEASGNWKIFDEINSKVDLVKLTDLNKTFNKYTGNIAWTYLGDTTKVATADFKQLSAVPPPPPPPPAPKLKVQKKKKG